MTDKKPSSGRAPTLVTGQPPQVGFGDTELDPLSSRRSSVAPAPPPPPRLNTQNDETGASSLAAPASDLDPSIDRNEHTEPERLATVPVPPPDKAPTIGDIVGGKYRLGRVLGSGGMGKVFAAVHVELDAPVAVKLMHPFVTGLPEHSQRFRREARAASRIDHPNVVRVLDFGIEGDTHYIVMEQVDGISLGDWLELQEGPPPFEMVVPVIVQILGALAAAHDAGVVHRDLKPDNIILSRDASGSPIIKIADFGLARFRDPADQGVTFTKDDAVSGTPGYMSPEQCRSLRVGPSADLYAFGCILTEVLQLNPPFLAETAIDVLSKQLFMPAGALERPEGAEPVPELLERLRLDLLAKSPDQRPASAEEVLGRFVEAFDPEAPAAQQPGRKRATPIGVRGDRIPRWNRDAARTERDESKPSDNAGIEVHLIRARAGVSGIEDNSLVGLAVQGIFVQTLPPETADARVILLDAGADFESATTALRSLCDGEQPQTVVVCINAPTQAQLNTLIEFGATEVMKLPTTADALARKVRRAHKAAQRRMDRP